MEWKPNIKTLGSTIFGWVDIRRKDRVFLFSLWFLSLLSWKTVQHLQNQLPPETFVVHEATQMYAPVALMTAKTDGAKIAETKENHTWKPFTSQKINALFAELKKGKYPAENHIVEAYLDLDVAAFLRYTGQSSAPAQLQDEAIKTWLRNQKQALTLPKNPTNLLQSIHQAVHRRKGLKYNRDHNVISSYFSRNRIQCRSGSTLIMLTWLKIAPFYKGVTPVFVNTPGHQQPGFVKNNILYYVESTSSSDKVHTVALSQLENTRLEKPVESLLALLAKATGQPHLYPEKNAVYFETEPLLHEDSKRTVSPILSLQTNGISGPLPPAGDRRISSSQAPRPPPFFNKERQTQIDRELIDSILGNEKYDITTEYEPEFYQQEREPCCGSTVELVSKSQIPNKLYFYLQKHLPNLSKCSALATEDRSTYTVRLQTQGGEVEVVDKGAMTAPLHTCLEQVIQQLPMSTATNEENATIQLRFCRCVRHWQIPEKSWR